MIPDHPLARVLLFYLRLGWAEHNKAYDHGVEYRPLRVASLPYEVSYIRTIVTHTTHIIITQSPEETPFNTQDQVYVQ